MWPLLAVLTATVPVAGVFTLSRIFYVRDLTLAFRSRFLFFRHSVYSGVWPLWDPYTSNGQSAASDALYQLFHFPTIPIRLLLPDVLAYNLWIALPVPLAALGTYLFLRHHVGRAAAAFGAMAFAVAGPTASMTNFPNLSWSVVCVPYVFWAIERLAARRRALDAALLAVIVGAQALSGEPVTFAASSALAAAYVAFGLRGLRDRRLLIPAAAAMILGVLLASIQYVPLAAAGKQSVRGLMLADDFWAFHPLATIELFVPHFFGDYFNSNLSELSWMAALNSNREPFYYTMYMGVPVMLAAGVAACSGRRRTLFWAIAVAACILASMGGHTPFYPILQAIVPGLKAFRFPVKYLSLAAMGISVLAALACQWLLDDDVPRRPLVIVLTVACALAIVAYAFIAWQLIAPKTPIYLVFRLAEKVGVRSPIQAAEFLIFRARPLFSSLILKVLCAAFLLAVAASRRPERRRALAAFTLLAVVDLLAANSSVNPTMPVSLLSTPAWVKLLPANLHERVYIGGRLEGYVRTTDIDAPKYAVDIPGYTPMEQRFITVNELVFHPSGEGLRETLSYDLPLLWPIDNARALTRFKESPRDERIRYLERTGVRYAVLPVAVPPGNTPLASLIGVEQLKLYDLDPAAKRAYVVPDALRGPDTNWEIEGMFQSRFNPAAGVLVDREPPPAAGVAGMPARPSAEFIEDGNNRVVVRAGLPAEGFLTLLDSYDPYWHVDVDGAPAPLMRVNGLFRAVHLRQGTHIVTFTYRPMTVYAGAAMSGAALLILAAWCAVDARRRRTRPA